MRVDSRIMQSLDVNTINCGNCGNMKTKLYNKMSRFAGTKIRLTARCIHDIIGNGDHGFYLDLPHAAPSKWNYAKQCDNFNNMVEG